MWTIVPLLIFWLIASLVLASFGKWVIWWTFIGFLVISGVTGMIVKDQMILLQAIVGMSFYLVPLAIVLGSIIWFARKLELALTRKKEF